MMKTAVLRIVNPILGVLSVNQITVGILHDMLPHKAFEILHEGGGIVLTVVAAFHVALNWNWIKVNFFHKRPLIVKA